MANPYRQPYLDTSVYLAAIKREPERAEIARRILEDARAGKVQVVGSTFVIAEIIRGKSETLPLTEKQERTIDAYLFHDFITWVEVDHSLALEARRLARQHGLKPVDAVHLASAIRGGADQLLRWDDKFRLKDGTYEGVEVCEPHWEGQLELEDAAS